MHTIFVKVADEALARAPKSVPRDDNTVYALAGFATGALYKSTTGVRGAALAAVVGTAASLVYLNGGSWVYYNLNKHKLHF